MPSDFSAYMQWVRQHQVIWTFERDDEPADVVPAVYRQIYSSILEALASAPTFTHPSARIHPTAQVGEGVIIEEGVQVLANAVVNGPSFVGRNAVIGNFSLLRGSCFLSRDSLVGNHCYCNEAVIGRGARVAHFANFSRSILGYNSSISAFVLTATVKADKSAIAPESSGLIGTAKLGCVIGANTFIAPHVVIQPGITIGHRCFIGSFSLVSDDVPDETYVGVERSLATRRNEVRIPKRKRIGDFLPRDTDPERRYAGVLLVDPVERLILQRRDSKTGTYNPGKLSAFGGRIEGTETPRQCARRELYEETGLDVREEELTFLMETLIVRQDKSKTQCTMYVLRNVKADQILLREGRGVELVSPEEAWLQSDITELCRAAITEYFKLRA